MKPFKRTEPLDVHEARLRGLDRMHGLGRFYSRLDRTAPRLPAFQRMLLDGGDEVAGMASQHAQRIADARSEAGHG